MRTSVGAIRAKLWWDDREDSRVKNRRDGGRAITGNTNLGVVMAESELRPVESLLNSRSQRHVLRPQEETR